jgi:hypothetical protein
MRALMTVLAILCALCARASATPAGNPISASASPKESTEVPQARFAIGVNSPLGWLVGSFGASAYVRLGDHFAARANVARFRNAGPGGLLGATATAFVDGETGYKGRLFDVGIGGVWYPRRPWDGFLLELGVLRRDRHTYVWPEFEPQVATQTTTYAGRALVGWSWLIGQHMFIAVAAGVSSGRETGHEISTDDYSRTTMTRAVDHQRLGGEGYLRIGVAFGD